MRRTSNEAVAPPLVPHSHDIGAADHAEFLGMRFCSRTQADVVAAIAANPADGAAPYRYVVTPNSYHVVAAHDEPARLPIYRAAWLSLCDSRIVQALARLDRLKLPLVTGSDLVVTLLATLNADERPAPPRRILVVGPPRSVAAILRARYPRITFDVMPAPAGLAHSAEAAPRGRARLHEPPMGHRAIVRRLSGPGDDRLIRSRSWAADRA